MTISNPSPSSASYVLSLRGPLIDLRDPNPESIRLTDIAWALANQNRYNGMTSRPWSQAAHILVVVDELKATLKHPIPPLLVKHTLLDVAYKAYMGDQVEPLVSALRHTGLPAEISRMRERLTDAIYQHLNLPPPTSEDRLAIQNARETVREEEYRYLGRDGRGYDLRLRLMIDRYHGNVHSQYLSAFAGL